MLGRLDAQDQHVFGQPAFVAAHDAGDAQGEAFFTQQGVAAVTAAVGNNQAIFGEVADVFDRRVAGPFDVFLARFQRGAEGVHAFDCVFVEVRHDFAAHAGHDPHIDHHVFRVGDLDAVAGKAGTYRAHAERDHVHGSAVHAAFGEVFEQGFHLFRLHPVVGGAGILLAAATDVGTIFDAGHVAGIAETGEAVGPFFGVEFDKRALVDQQLTEIVVFFL